MRDYLATLAGPDYVDAILWTLAALLALVVLLAVAKGVRTMNSGTFVAGGRARKTRLAVMDATAIDSQRRLVLVRRDDVEHLLLIGGPSDVVVEQDIRVMGQRRPAPEASRPPVNEGADAPLRPEPGPAQRPPLDQRPPLEASPPHGGRPPAPAAERPQRPYAPEPRRAPEPARPGQDRLPPAPHPVAAAPRQAAVPRPAGAAPPRPQMATASTYAPRTEAPPRRETPRDSIDDTLMNELDLSSADITPTGPDRNNQSPSLDDEMARLFGEIANPKR